MGSPFCPAPLPSSACLLVQDGCRVFSHRLLTLSRCRETPPGQGWRGGTSRKPHDNFHFHVIGHPVHAGNWLKEEGGGKKRKRRKRRGTRKAGMWTWARCCVISDRCSRIVLFSSN